MAEREGLAPRGEVMREPGQSTRPGEPLPDREGAPAGAPNPDATIARGGSEDDVREQATAAASRRRPAEGPPPSTEEPEQPGS